MAAKLPDWAKPGTPAVVAHTNGWGQYGLHDVVIARTTGTQAIVEVAHTNRAIYVRRFASRNRSGSGDGDLYEVASGSVYDRDLLLPADDPRLVKWRAEATLRHLLTRARNAADRFERNPDTTTAKDAMLAINAWVAATAESRES